MKNRLTNRDKLEHPDIFEYLMPEKGQPDPSEDWLLSHANVLIVAGFDLLANLSTSIIYFLTKHPEKLRLMATEVRDAFTSYDEIVSEPLQRLKYLHAVMEESLRLYINAAFGLPRLCPGATIDDHVVPKGVRGFS